MRPALETTEALGAIAGDAAAAGERAGAGELTVVAAAVVGLRTGVAWTGAGAVVATGLCTDGPQAAANKPITPVPSVPKRYRRLIDMVGASYDTPKTAVM